LRYVQAKLCGGIILQNVSSDMPGVEKYRAHFLWSPTEGMVDGLKDERK
jgi:hypothetical protein